MLISTIIIVSSFGAVSIYFITFLALMALALIVDAAIIWWRSVDGDYGLTNLEVKEIARLVAAAKRRRDSGNDPGTFARIFPDQRAVTDVPAWAHPESLRP